MTPQTVYSTEAKPKPPKLLDQVREKLRLKHYSIRTEKQYCSLLENLCQSVVENSMV